VRAVDHYLIAEDLLERYEDNQTILPDLNVRIGHHAMLALAGATALQAYSRGNEAELDDWADAAGGGS
jgi:hypothetical protein